MDNAPTEQQEQAPIQTGNGASQQEGEERLLRDLHKLLVETQVVEGKMQCGSCGHEYKIKEGIANFLLPSHLV
jgi:multifunctional methyltransferase subunit TRM112